MIHGIIGYYDRSLYDRPESMFRCMRYSKFDMRQFIQSSVRPRFLRIRFGSRDA